MSKLKKLSHVVFATILFSYVQVVQAQHIIVSLRPSNNVVQPPYDMSHGGGQVLAYTRLDTDQLKITTRVQDEKKNCKTRITVLSKEDTLRFQEGGDEQFDVLASLYLHQIAMMHQLMKKKMHSEICNLDKKETQGFAPYDQLQRLQQDAKDNVTRLIHMIEDAEQNHQNYVIDDYYREITRLMTFITE